MLFEAAASSPLMLRFFADISRLSYADYAIFLLFSHYGCFLRYAVMPLSLMLFSPF